MSSGYEFAYTPNVITLADTWYEQIKHYWVGKDGMVVILKDKPETAIKLLFESRMFCPSTTDDLCKANPSINPSLIHCPMGACPPEQSVAKRIRNQVAMYEYLLHNPMFDLSAIEIIGNVSSPTGKLVGYAMPRIDYPAININSNPDLKQKVLLFEARSGFIVDRVGKNAFALGKDSYMLIDVDRISLEA